MKKLRLTGLFLTIAVGAIVLSGCTELPLLERLTPGTHVLVGNPAPDFTVNTTGGYNFTLSDHRGQVVVLILMTIIADPCDAQTAHMREMWSDYDNFTIIYVDPSQVDTDAQLISYGQRHHTPWLLAIDHNQTMPSKYPTDHVPAAIVIDQGGIIRYVKEEVILDDEIGVVAEDLLGLPHDGQNCEPVQQYTPREDDKDFVSPGDPGY